MGILDQLFAQSGYGLFGGNYPSTIFHQPEEAQAAREAAAATLARSFRRRPQEEQAAPPSIFDTGGAGSMLAGQGVYGLDPSAFAPPPPTPMATIPGGLPAPAAAPMAPAPAAAPAPQDGPSSFINIGDYRMPVFGSPDPAQLPANAQPAQGTLPQQGAAPNNMFAPNNPSVLDRLNSGLQSIGNGGSIIGALTGNHTDPVTVQRQSQQAIYSAAIQAGLDKNKAFLVATNPKAFETYAQQLFGAKEPPKTVEELVVRNAWQNGQGSGSAGTSGVGGSPMPTTIEGLQQYQANQKAAEARAKVTAEEQAKLAVSLPDTLTRAEQTIKQIDELKQHGAKGYRTGFSSIAPAIPGTSGVDFDERVKQIKGAAFLDAYRMLRGTGAISEAEGIKAEQAQARLSQAKSEKDFDQALDDLRAVVVTGYGNAQKMAGQQTVKPYEMPVGQSRTINGVTIKRVN